MEFHQTLQTHSYLQGKYLQVGFFKKNPIERSAAATATAAADDNGVSQ